MRRVPHPTPPPPPWREYDLDHGVIHTDIRPAAARALCAAFVLLIFSVPLGQVLWELMHSETPVVLRVFQVVPTRGNLRQYEQDLENASLPREYFQPRVQLGVTGFLGFGSNKVVVGRDGWLFYAPGVDYLTGRGFIQPEQLHNRHKKSVDEGKLDLHPDPRPAILEFHEQCRERGVRLVLLPIPDKAQIQPAQVTRYAEFREPIAPPRNPDDSRFSDELRRQGVEVLDVAPAELSATDRRFLVQDTHWTAAWMSEVARQVADRLQSDLPAAAAPPALRKQPEEVARLGDLVDMLRLPPDQTLYQPQSITVERILDTNRLPWQPSATADVLVLGDSFSNIYSSDRMGWGDSAGFVEHLAYYLGRPVDRLVRNDSGAYATREMLADELRRGNDRLAGKKFVVWQFAARELACGDWKPVPLVLGEKMPSDYYVPKPGQTPQVRGLVRDVSPAPRPGTVPYKDHILMIHLADLQSEDAPEARGKEAVILAWSMRDNRAMPAARFRPGDTIRLRLRPWSEVAARYESLNRSMLDDEDLLLADRAWAETEPQE